MSIEPSPEGPSIALRREGAAVPLLATRMSETQIAVALDLGHVGAFGVAPSQVRLAMGWAMICHETGRGQKGCYNYNLGNVDATDDWHGDVMTLTADEGSGATVHKETKWLRAYPDAYSGAVGWWQFIAARFPGHAAKPDGTPARLSVLAAFDTGDGDIAEEALRGYFSGDRAAYARELRLLSAEYVRRVGKGGL